ncbi:MAG: hypothetical protein Q9169_007281, partial [Polycauliona sp. 2 TL-2023]
MGREEQIEEREVLDSIFPDEITGKNFAPHLKSPCLTTNAIDIDEKSYRITINPDVPQQDGEDVES